MLAKINKTIVLLRKLQDILHIPSLLTIYCSLSRTHLDYGGVIYDRTYKASSQSSEHSV